MLLILSLLVLIVQVIDACEAPFEVVEGGCYYYNEDLFVGDWDTANEFCVGLDATMVVVKSGDENRAIVENLLIRNVEADRVLLGARANDMGLLEWVDGTLVRDGFDAWGENQPSGNGDCMGYSVDHEYFWDDFPCDNYTDTNALIGYICEQAVEQNTTTTQGPTTPTIPGTTTPGTTTPTTITTMGTTTPFECPDEFEDLETGCYHVSSDTMDWAGALDYCESLYGSHITYITSADEQDNIETYIEDNEVTASVWIGAFDQFGDDVMYWLDGTAVDDGYTNYYDDWIDGGDNDALYLASTQSWQWADTTVDLQFYVLCEIDL